MKDPKKKRNVRIEFVVSEQEAELIQERMAELGITNLCAYLRICSNNLNQYTRRANETGSVYAADVEDLHTRLDNLWFGMEKLLRSFADIP